MIDFTKLTGIEHGGKVVTQIEDSAGRVLWVVQSNEPIVLEVEKVTSNTYAGETTYENEEFILLDIYPKTNGTVSVTYGGLTKTITDTSGAEEPNAQQVYFGTLHGVTDSVATPASGILTIEGDCYAFGVGSVGLNKGAPTYVGGITTVKDWGNVKTFIPGHAFQGCKKLTSLVLPDGITSVGINAFYGCTGLTSIILPDGITFTGENAFYGCTGLTSITIPNNLSSINLRMFYGCTGLTSIVLPDGITSIDDSAFDNCTGLTSIKLNEGLKTIGASAFRMQTNNSGSIALYKGEITFPSTLESIGAEAFRYNYSSGTGDTFYYTYIGTAIMLSQTPPTLGDSAFGHGGSNDENSNSGHITIIVPKGCGEAYKNAEGWSRLANYITEAT